MPPPERKYASLLSEAEKKAQDTPGNLGDINVIPSESKVHDGALPRVILPLILDLPQTIF